MNKKIYCLIGKSGSGKSTLERLLEKKGIKRIISTTTRPIRDTENSQDYNFVTDAEFKQLELDGNLYENTSYRKWSYGIDKKFNQIDLNKNNYCCVIEIHGYNQLLKSVGKDNLVAIYITVNDKERMMRSLNREVNPDVKELSRRLISDTELFDGFDKQADYIFENNDAEDVANKIFNIINFDNNLDIEIKEDLVVGNQVKIIKVLNPLDAPHLEHYIGSIGFVFSWLIKDDVKRYKIVFEDKDKPFRERFNDSAYFLFDELLKLED